VIAVVNIHTLSLYVLRGGSLNHSHWGQASLIRY
jgi:hypothetical protein